MKKTKVWSGNCFREKKTNQKQHRRRWLSFGLFFWDERTKLTNKIHMEISIVADPLPIVGFIGPLRIFLSLMMMRMIVVVVVRQDRWHCHMSCVSLCCCQFVRRQYFTKHKHRRLKIPNREKPCNKFQFQNDKKQKTAKQKQNRPKEMISYHLSSWS